MVVGRKVKDLKNGDFLFAAAFFVLAAGVILGSVYLSGISEETGEGIKGYIEDFMHTGNIRSNFEVFKNAVKENFLIFIVVFLSGFFRIGTVFTVASVVRKGFVIGFTVSSFIKYYGLKGLLIMSATMPSMLIIIPALLIFSAISVNFSVSREKNQKKSVFSYIFFAILIFTIFCVAAFFEGYLTTTFMKIIFPKQP